MDNKQEPLGDSDRVYSERTQRWYSFQGLDLEVIQGTIKNIASKICSKSLIDNPELQHHFNVLLDFYDFNENNKVSVAELLNQIGITERLVEILKLTQGEEYDDVDKDMRRNDLQLVVLEVCLKFSQVSSTFSQDLSRFGAVRCLTTSLKNTLIISERDVSQYVRSYVLILHNIAVNKTDTHDFVFAKTAQVLEKCATYVDDVIRVASVLTLGHIYSVEDVRGLKIKPETVVRCCLEWLKEASTNRKRTNKNGFQAWAVILGLARLAENFDFRAQIKTQDGFLIVSRVTSGTRDPKEKNACKKFLKMAVTGSDPRVPKVMAKQIAEVRPMINQTLTRQRSLPPIAPKPMRSVSERKSSTSDSVSEAKEYKEIGNTIKQDKYDYSQLRQIDLLLIGKTGNGKSAAGNTILGRRAFRSVSSFTSVTKDIEYEVVKFQDRLIKVVDAPGVADTDGISDFTMASRCVVEKMKHAVTVNPEGYHAFLLVIKYGNRFTAEDQFCIRMLKSVFGEEFIRNFCILVVTCGDRFKEENENTKFRDWCKHEEGGFNEILNECSNRAVLFDNSSKDAMVRSRQMKKLMKAVDNMQFAGRRYTDSHFDEVAAERERFIQDYKEPMIREDTIKQTSIMLQDLEEFASLDAEVQIKELGDLKERASAVRRRVFELDGGTGALQQQMQTVSALVRATEEKISILSQCVKERKDLARERSEIELKYTVKIKRQSRCIDHTFDELDLQNQPFEGTTPEERDKEMSNDGTRLLDTQKQTTLPERPVLSSDVGVKEKRYSLVGPEFIQRLKNMLQTYSGGAESTNLSLEQMNLAGVMEAERERVQRLIEEQKNKWQTELGEVRKVANTNVEEIQKMERRLKEDFQEKIEQLTNEFEERLKLILQTYEVKHSTDRAALQIMFKEMKTAFDECIKLSSSEEASNCAVS